MELSHTDVVSILSLHICVETPLDVPSRAWKVAPALAVGCTIVMKPSEITPLTALVRTLLRSILENSSITNFVWPETLGTGEGSWVSSSALETSRINTIA